MYEGTLRWVALYPQRAKSAFRMSLTRAIRRGNDLEIEYLLACLVYIHAVCEGDEPTWRPGTLCVIPRYPSSPAAGIVEVAEIKAVTAKSAYVRLRNGMILRRALSSLRTLEESWPNHPPRVYAKMRADWWGR